MRCKGTYQGRPCNRRFFDGAPGWDIISRTPKVLKVKCPKCGNINLVSSKLFEKVIVKLEKERDEK